MSGYTSPMPPGRDGFLQVLRAEWTKFRTVPGWVVGVAVAALLMVALGLVAAAGTRTMVADAGQGPGAAERLAQARRVPIGPDGEAVTDAFYFVHRSLDGDGTVTARVTSLTAVTLGQPGGAPTSDGLQPWTKAGLIVKQNTTQGSAYAAVMVTGGHGVRMQYNYTGDRAGPAGAVSATSPRWLRLTRTGDTVTGYASTDGSTWTDLGSVHLGLPSTVQIGLFVASPGQQEFDQHLGGFSASGSPTLATATFDSVGSSGRYLEDAWSGVDVGSDGGRGSPRDGSVQESGGTFTVKGAGNISPSVDGAGNGIERTLVGAFAALAVVAVLGVLFVTTEYRRGLIRISLAASPRRGRVLAAKAVVIGAVTFVAALIGAVVAVPASSWLLRHNGNVSWPLRWTTDVRIVAGTAALIAVTSVLALAVGTILRRSAAAVAAVIVLAVLPYILAVAGVLPAAPAQWLLRITPAAAFAVQQSVRAYPQVDQAYTPVFGFYPLPPWAGFAVLCAWTAVALGTAGYLLRRRDA